MSVAYFFALLCAAQTCVQHGHVVQVPVPPDVVSYTRPIEAFPRTWYDDHLYILVPESEV